MVVVGAVDDHAQVRCYTDRLPAVAMSLVRLHASRDHLAERIGRRRNGEGPQIPGERLRGLDAVELAQVVDAAEADDAKLASAGIGDVVVETDGRTVAEIADEICQRVCR